MGSGSKIFKPVKSILGAASGGLLDGITGSGAEDAAKKQAQASIDAANIQAQSQREANDAITRQSQAAAQQAQQQAQLDSQRNAAQADAKDTLADQDTTPTVDLSLGASKGESEAERRKRYNQGSTSIGGAIGSGVRL